MGIFALVLQNLASTSFFALRPFLAAFLVSLVGRVGHDLITTQGTGIGALPPSIWLMSDLALTIFGILAALEMLAASNEDAWPLYNDTVGIFQGGSSFVVSFGLLDNESVKYLELLAHSVPTEWLLGLAAVGSHVAYVAGARIDIAIDQDMLIQAAGWIGHAIAIVWAALMAGLAWFIGTIRYVLVEIIETLDPHNSFGLRTLIQWMETGWTATAAVIVVLIPALAIAIFLITVGSLGLIRWIFQRQEKKAIVACDQCGQPVHLCAPACPHCRRARQPRAVGLFGQATNRTESEPTIQRTNLIARKRCPTCATQLKERAVQQPCPTCGTTTFADIAAVNTFLRGVDQRISKTLGICFVLGLIPLVGIIPGIMYYQLSLVGSLRGYVPRSVGCLTRWGVRIINLGLIALQPIPVLGALTLPLMAFISYQVYRGVLVQQSQSKLARTFDPVGGATGEALVALTPGSSAAPAHPAGQCRVCGAQNGATDRFCGSCGASLGG